MIAQVERMEYEYAAASFRVKVNGATAGRDPTAVAFKEDAGIVQRCDIADQRIGEKRPCFKNTETLLARRDRSATNDSSSKVDSAKKKS